MTNVNVNFKNVTILSPVYNERETIISFLIEIQKVITTLVSNFNVKTYLINDGSVDGTFDLDFLSKSLYGFNFLTNLFVLPHHSIISLVFF
jgi:hypothetical protein